MLRPEILPLDYALGGMKIKTHLAIDFTRFNKRVSNEEGYHYITGKEPTRYKQVFEAFLKELESTSKL